MRKQIFVTEGATVIRVDYYTRDDAKPSYEPYRATLRIMRPDDTTESGSYIPAQSIELSRMETLKSLRDALNVALEEYER